MKLAAILWDYDGTLVDSTLKNMAVSIEILSEFIPDIESNLPEALKSKEKYIEANHQYKNWRELYINEFGLGEDIVDEAGKLWSPSQIKNKVLPELFPQIDEVIKCFDDIKHGICSQNCSLLIKDTLDKLNLSDYFDSVIGYNDLSFENLKPHPSGFMKWPQRDGTLS